MLDAYMIRRLLLTLGVTGVIVSVCVAIGIANGATLQDLAANWIVVPAVLMWTAVIIDLTGKLRSPAEEYERMLDDDLHR